MSKPIIEVKGISKCYKLGSIGAQTMRDEVEAFFARFKKTKSPATSHSLPATSSNQPLATTRHPLPVTRHSAAGASEFWALRDVSFDVQPGEVVGIIGRNGAGKSTLLKILSRITEPTNGEIRVRGRIASLLEVGTGFHPELSGRENIFLNGAILGMTKAEIRAKFDEIVDFAGVEQFIDTPVKRYSSGMYVRLAFAVAAHLEPEILIVDEVLAVGDAEFQKKCLGKMKDVAGHGRTILFVSHNMGAMITLCTSAIWLNNGSINYLGDTRDVVDQYLKKNTENHESVMDLGAISRSGEFGKKLLIKKIEWTSGLPIKHGEKMTARIYFNALKDVDEVSLGIGFSTLEGTRLLTFETDFQEMFRPNLNEGSAHFLDLAIPEICLGPGVYSLDIGARSGDNFALDFLPSFAQMEVAIGKNTPGTIVRQGSGVRMRSDWIWNR
jgi:lipopolysaccharide transport system ATP-binding protein